MRVYKSKFTPNIKGSETHFEIGEKVLYQPLSGETEEIIINSDIMAHASSPSGLCYEAICLDGNTYAIDPDRIISWEGKNHPDFYPINYQ